MSVEVSNPLLSRFITVRVHDPMLEEDQHAYISVDLCAATAIGRHIGGYATIVLEGGSRVHWDVPNDDYYRVLLDTWQRVRAR